MKTRLRKEEYTALGDFITLSFVRDQAVIAAKFPKLDNAFLTAFTAKLNFVKHLESSVVKMDKQKKATAALYQTAGELNAALTILNSYIADADLTTAIITAIKIDIGNRNIEGAILKLEGLEQYVAMHHEELEAQGMAIGYSAALLDYKTELETKNGLQNEYMNQLRELAEKNRHHYGELYGFISRIADKGKLVFADSVVHDEYTISKIQRRMRFIKAKKDGKGKDAT